MKKIKQNNIHANRL